MAEVRKVKEIDYEAAWNALKSSLRALYDDTDAVFSRVSFAEFVAGQLIGYEKVLSLMVDFEELYEEAE